MIMCAEPLPCPECGAKAMRLVVETRRMVDGLQVPQLRHSGARRAARVFLGSELCPN